MRKVTKPTRASTAQPTPRLTLDSHSERKIMVDLALGLQDGEPVDWVTVELSREMEEFVRFEVTSSDDPDRHALGVTAKLYGQFRVPLSLMPQLSLAFAVLTKRAQDEELLGVKSPFHALQQRHTVAS